MAHPRAALARLVWLAPLCAAIVAASTLLGYTPIDWTSPDGLHRFFAGDVFWKLRLPRVALAAAAGAALALGGAIFQTLFRNPLAEPYTLGIASGASLGAAIAFIAQVTGYYLWLPKLSVFALLGGSAAMLVVLLLARSRAGQDMTRVLLAGVCVAYTSSAGILLATFLARKPVTNDLVMWMMGSLALYRWQSSVEIAVVLLPVAAAAVAMHRALDLLATGDNIAASRGVAVGATVWGFFIGVGALTAVTVANCGPIGFVGLMVPHIVRHIVGIHSISLVLGSVFVGSAFLAVCDGLARSVTVHEMPVGIITNIAGAACFVGVLLYGGRRESGSM